jgi:hypothetical protein
MLIFAFFFISKKYQESIDYMLAASLGSFLVFSFSGNYRQTLVSDNNIKLCYSILKKRIYFFPLIFLFSFYISFFYLGIKNLHLIFLGNFIVITIWLNEISLIIIEIKKDFNNLIYKILFNYLLLFIIFGCFFYLENKYLILLIIIYSFLIYIQNFNIDFLFTKISFKEIKFIFAINYISSISINLSSFIFRYEINYFLDVKSGSFILFCITAGSSLSTIAFNSFGPRDFNHTTKLSNQSWLFLFFYLLACLLTYFLIDRGFFFDDQKSDLKYALIISILGGLIFTIAYIFRQNIISKKTYRNAGFVLDIIFSIVVVISVPMLFYFGEYYLIFSYLFTSFISLMLYWSFYKHVVKK